MDMCPASEIERRTRIEDISSFERIVPNRAETNTELAVKKFARNVSQPFSSQQQQPERRRSSNTKRAVCNENLVSPLT